MKKVCEVHGCLMQSKRKGFCSKHYTRLLRHGSPTGGGATRGHVREWLTSHVHHEGDNCLVWPFATWDGYGICNYEGRSQIASRIMCRLAHGEPENSHLEAAHSCGRGKHGCVNPNHLRWATPHENQMDKALHGTSARGDRNNRAVLTASDVVEIRLKLRAGIYQKDVAKQFSVHPSTVSLIASGKNWSWL